MDRTKRGEVHGDADWPGVPEPGEGPTATRQAYRSPRLRPLGSAADLIEVLGPAQANYGGA